MTVTLSHPPNTLKLLSLAALKRTSKQLGNLKKQLSLPSTKLVLKDQTANSLKINQFHEVVAWPERKNRILHPSFLHIMAFPLHLQLMLQGDFPFALLGLVHIKNDIVQHRPVETHEAVSICCYFDQITPHSKGWVFGIKSEARVQDEIVWHSTSVNLFRTSSSTAAKNNSGDIFEALSGETQYWSLASPLGRQYAKASGDYNPIHLHSLVARLFGFKRQIAHGMWSKARCLSAFEHLTDEPFHCHCSFLKPIFLPTKVDFTQSVNQRTTDFSLSSNRQSIQHLIGQINSK